MGRRPYRQEICAKGLGALLLPSELPIHASVLDGAQHLFGALMTFVDGRTEPTKKDMRRIARINEELQELMDDTTSH